jgi:hypothetical protein
MMGVTGVFSANKSKVLLIVPRIVLSPGLRGNVLERVVLSAAWVVVRSSMTLIVKALTAAEGIRLRETALTSRVGNNLIVFYFVSVDLRIVL